MSSTPPTRSRPAFFRALRAHPSTSPSPPRRRSLRRTLSGRRTACRKDCCSRTRACCRASRRTPGQSPEHHCHRHRLSAVLHQTRRTQHRRRAGHSSDAFRVRLRRLDGGTSAGSVAFTVSGGQAPYTVDVQNAPPGTLLRTADLTPFTNPTQGELFGAIPSRRHLHIRRQRDRQRNSPGYGHATVHAARLRADDQHLRTSPAHVRHAGAELRVRRAGSAGSSPTRPALYWRKASCRAITRRPLAC